jgi:membrane-associated phospholipid phosphatase
MQPKTLLRNAVIVLLAGTVLVTLAFFFVDRPFAFYVYDHGINQMRPFQAMTALPDELREARPLIWLTEPPMWLQYLAPLVLMVAAVKMAWQPLTRLERTLFCMAANLLVTFGLETTLKWVFGRNWPDTWIHGNLSLIQNGAYGFNLFHGNEEYGSFPSGHTARVFSVMSVLWIAYPRWRWLCVVACASVIVGLLGMDYHFVGDVIGGACLGSITGMYAAYFARLYPER